MKRADEKQNSLVLEWEGPARLKKLWLRQNIQHPYRYLALGILLFAFLLLEIYSRSAAMIFDYAMENQDMLHGTITVEKLTASPTGHVHFQGLEWKDIEGKRILFIPDGSFRVDIFDVLTKDFSSLTVEELTLNRAVLSLRFNEDMSVDFVRTPSRQERAQSRKQTLKARDEEKTEEQLLAEGEARRRIQRERLEQDWTNFNHDDKPLDLHIYLNDCRVEVFYRERHYLLESVRFHMDCDSTDDTYIKLATGPFGGTMIGGGIFLEGKIDFEDVVPDCDIAVIMDAVDPSSLGFGMDLHDPLSMNVRLQGKLPHPVGRGELHLDKLRIPGLYFTDVNGYIFYKDAMLRFADVRAKVFDGTLNAAGWYNLDTRYYFIGGHGQQLSAKKALPKEKLNCFVDLDINVDSKGSVKKTAYSGRFISGEGSYGWLPFRSIRGRFHNLDKKLDFYDVNIDFGGLIAKTDALSLHKGQLTFLPIHVTDANGNPLVIYDPDKKELIDPRTQ